MDLYYLVGELKCLVGAKLEKAYEQEEDKKDFLFAFHKAGLGKLMLRVKLPGLAYLTGYKPSFPDFPPGFCAFIRKHLGNARVKDIRQRAFERILEIVFDTKTGERILVCELFSKGNMILVDEDYKIKGLLESQNWEARTIRGGTKYSYPPAQADTPRIDFPGFEKIVSSTQFDSIVKCFAIDLGLGGFYAEELCTRSKILKAKNRLSPEELHCSYKELIRLFNMSLDPNIAGGQILPFRTGYAAEKSYDSLSAAIDDLLTEKIEAEKVRGAEREKLTKKKKAELVIEKQEERLVQLDKEILECQRKGELIYENYATVKEFLEKINLDRKRMNWEELKKKYESIEIDGNKGFITVDL
jgi:predicted ribosome quality control (RQC) complex YloA/Tae2 family protein